MKNLKPMYIVLLVLSAVLLILPVFLESMQSGELNAYALICVFCIFAVGMIYLVLKRKALADREVAQKVTILCWELPAGKGVPLWQHIAGPIAVLMSAVCLSAVLLILWAKASVAVALCLCGALLFAFGGVIISVCAQKYLDYGGEHGFRLCHNALYLCGTRMFLDGLKCAVFDVSLDKKARTLRLGIMRKNTQNYMSIDVPADQLDIADTFIKKLSEHFKESEA